MPETSAPSSAVSSRLQVIKKRADFLRANHARRQATKGFILQARRRNDGEVTAPDTTRIGYTCSKRVGNAVARNRAKRRLRAIAQQVLSAQGRAGWDYVLIGRAEHTADLPFDRLLADLEFALNRVHAPKKQADPS